MSETDRIECFIFMWIHFFIIIIIPLHKVLSVLRYIHWGNLSSCCHNKSSSTTKFTNIWNMSFGKLSQLMILTIDHSIFVLGSFLNRVSTFNSPPNKTTMPESDTGCFHLVLCWIWNSVENITAKGGEKKDASFPSCVVFFLVHN